MKGEKESKKKKKKSSLSKIEQPRSLFLEKGVKSSREQQQQGGVFFRLRPSEKKGDCSRNRPFSLSELSIPPPFLQSRPTAAALQGSRFLPFSPASADARGALRVVWVRAEPSEAGRESGADACKSQKRKPWLISSCSQARKRTDE